MKLLIITHDTTRTGAPMVLLHFLRWLKQHKSHVQADVLALKSGDLAGAFQEVSHNYFDYSSITQSNSTTFIKKVLNELNFTKSKAQREVALLKILAKQGYQFVYANTVLAIPIGIKVASVNKYAKLLVHIHELNVIIHQLCPELTQHASQIDLFIAASNLVKNNLIDIWKVPETKVIRVYESAYIEQASMEDKKPKAIFQIGGSGTVHWRKGSDLFIQVARYLKTHYPNRDVQFTWVGSISKTEKLIIDEDLRKTNLQDLVQFVGEQVNPIHLFNSFDVFLMCSREDPFPLVCIEVGMLGIPIICFEKATGSAEIIEKGGGTIVPYLNTEAMAEAIIDYMDVPEKLIDHGANNKKEFSRFSPELICPELFEIMEQQLKENE